MADIALGVVFALIAMLGFGLSNGIAKVPSEKIGCKNTIFFRNIMTSAMLFILIFFFLSETVLSPIYLLFTFLISIIGYIALLSFFKGLEKGKVGLVSPVANSSVILTVLLSVIFFNEVLSTLQILAVLMILAGIVLISINFRDIKNSKLLEFSSGVPYALLTCLLWGILFFLYKIPVMILGPVLTAFIIEFGMLITSATDFKISRKVLIRPDKKMLKSIFLVAFFAVIGAVFFNMGIKIYSVSIVAAITLSSPLVATLYSKFAYKEILDKRQWLSIILILIGIISISYF